jgi:predicted AlkP superfamily pyrophosphatase or phosphodiesterase
MSHATVFIIMDGGRADYLSPKTMPFLHGLGQRSVHGELETTPGHTQRTALFTGRYPDTSGNFLQFAFDPEQSPYQWTRRLGPIRPLIRARRAMYPARAAIERITRWAGNAYHSDPAWIPPKLLPFFRPCEDMKPLHAPDALGAKSIFDLCRERNLRFRYLAHPVSGDDQEVHATLVRELRQGAPYDFYVTQYSIADQKGHTHGPHSAAVRQRHLRDLDEKFATIHAALVAGYDSWDLFIVGSHGMSPVDVEIDLVTSLKASKAKPGKDYVVFVDTTIALFWYLTKTGRDEIEPLLPTIPRARVIDHGERVTRRIPTDRRWGDAMLAVEPGAIFWPDYFHVRDSKIVGAHGYLDKTTEGHGAMVLTSSNGHTNARLAGKRPLVDVFPTLCDLLGLATPYGQEGTSLLSAAHARIAPTSSTALPAPKVIADV